MFPQPTTIGTSPQDETCAGNAFASEHDRLQLPARVNSCNIAITIIDADKGEEKAHACVNA